jgi:hypothetical protein
MRAFPSTEDLARAAAKAPFDAPRYCAAADAFARPVMRQSLCTVNRLARDTMQLARLYSSNPVAYPPGGRKDKRGTAWGEQVLVRRQMYVGEGVAAIRASFDDHAMIERLGLRSVVNVPVAFEERCLGTLNLLMTAASVTPEQIEFARLLGVLLLPALFDAAPTDRG